MERYAHDHPQNFILQEYLPDRISGTAFYRPGLNAREEEMRRFLRERWKGKYGY
jgi:putative ATPase